jgi:gliding motility-associated-like protein
MSNWLNPYNYQWSGPSFSASTEDISGLGAGVYLITATDAAGCIDSGQITITGPTAISATFNNIDESCVGYNDGQATVIGAGGTVALDYSYSWSSGNTSASATGLAAGNYIVTLSDDNGCTGVGNALINSGPSITANIMTSDACLGVSSFFNASGSSHSLGSPLTYNWDFGDGGNGGGINSLYTYSGVGSYTVIVTATDGTCNDVVSANAIVHDIPTTSIVSTNVTCNGVCDGTVDATGSGGDGGPYIHSWNNGLSFGAFHDMLCGGTYIVTVTDGTGCTAEASVVISEPSPVSLALSASFDNFCFGASNGVAFVDGTGGTVAGDHSYSWSSGDTVATATGLAAGTYTVTTSDDNSCFAVDTFNITQPATAITISTAIDNHVSCFGLADGQASVSGAGGTVAVDYSYGWSSGDTVVTANGLAAGTYTVTIADDNNCFDIDTINITQPNAITISSTIDNNVSCFGLADGQASVSGAGGTVAVDYSYGWSSGDTVVTANGLAAGTYIVTIADDNNCFDIDTINITQPSAAVSFASVASVNISCFGLADGQASVSGAGGTVALDYSYSWSSGNNAATATGLNTGSYIVTLSDDNSCLDIDTINITQPSAAVSFASVGSVNISCFGLADGQASVSGAGGTVAIDYSYSWSSGNNAASATGLAAGNYIVTLSDDNSCLDIDTINITQPTAITISSTIDNNISCFGLADGQASVSGAGGTVAIDYSYGWSSGNNAATATGLSGGAYSVTVADDNGCFATDNFNLSQPSALSITQNCTNTSALGSSDGGSIASLAGGTTPYFYVWSTGDSVSSLTGIPAGSYSVTASDINGCAQIANCSVSGPPYIALSVTSNISNVICNGDLDGAINLVISGGTTPFSFVWSNNSITQNVTGLNSGLYSVTVSDGITTAVLSDLNLSEPPQIEIDFTSIPDTICPGGEVIITASGGTDYDWINEGSTSSALTVLVDSGRYFLVETTIGTCSAIDSIYIPVLSASDCASLSNLDPPNAFSPDGDGTNDSWIIQGIEFTDNKVTIFNRWGDNIGEFENYDNSSVVWSGTNKSGELLPTGTYFYVIEIDGVITKRDWIQIVR